MGAYMTRLQKLQKETMANKDVIFHVEVFFESINVSVKLCNGRDVKNPQKKIYATFYDFCSPEENNEQLANVEQFINQLKTA